MEAVLAEQKRFYRIRVKGILNLATVHWFNGISILPQENDETVLDGEFLDQAALRGLLEQLWNLNYTVLAVELVETSEGTIP